MNIKKLTAASAMALTLLASGQTAQAEAAPTSPTTSMATSTTIAGKMNQQLARLPGGVVTSTNTITYKSRGITLAWADTTSAALSPASSWWSHCPDGDYCFWTGPSGTGQLKLTTSSLWCPGYGGGEDAFLILGEYGMAQQVASVDSENNWWGEGWDNTRKYVVWSLPAYGDLPSVNPSLAFNVTICPININPI